MDHMSGTCFHCMTGFPRVSEKSGKINFFQGQGIVREFWKMSVKFKNYENVREKSGNFVFEALIILPNMVKS